MDRFKTLSRNDPEFTSFLDGSFSSDVVALPVRSLNVGTSSEQVTFEIVPTRSVTKPAAGRIAWQMIRPSSLVFSIGPMVTTLFFCAAHGFEVDRFIGVTAFLGVILFQIAMNLFNDYGDHMKGQDRLRPKGGSRAIQKGWIRAVTVKRLAWLALFFAALLGLPAVLFSLSRAAIIAVIALFVAIEFAFQRLRLKYRGWAEVFAWLLTGPLLFVGYSWAVADHATLSEVLLGGIFGSIALMYYHSANFENIMVDEQAGARTWATRAGFDASKKFFYFTAGLTLAFTSAYFVFVESEWIFVSALLAQAMFLIPVCLRVKNLASPLSSQLTGLRLEAVRLCALTTLALSGTFVYILVSR